MEEQTLKVGDRIRIQNWMNDFVVEIARVTKTMAITKPFNSANAVYRFKLKMWDNKPSLVKEARYSTTQYTKI